MSDKSLRFPERPQIRMSDDDVFHAEIIALATGLRAPTDVFREALRIAAALLASDEVVYLYYDEAGVQQAAALWEERNRE